MAEYNMKLLIEKYRFVEADQDKYLELFDALNKASSETQTKQSLIDALDALRLQVGVENFPYDMDDTHASYMGKKSVEYIASAAEDNNIAKSEIGAAMFKVYLACFPPSGPTSGQAEIMDEIVDQLKDYLEKMQGEELSQLTKAYTRDFLARLPDIENDTSGRFYGQIHSHLQRVLSHSLSEDYQKHLTAAEDYVKLYVYSQNKIATLEESDAAQIHYVIVRDIRDLFEEGSGYSKKCHLYDTINDPNLFEDHLKQIGDLVCCPSFPKDHQKGLPSDWMGIILDHLLLKPDIGKTYVQCVVDLMLRLAQHCTEHSLDIAKKIARFFSDQDKDGKKFIQFVNIDINSAKPMIENVNKYDGKLGKECLHVAKSIFADVILPCTRFKPDKSGMFEALATLTKSNNETIMKMVSRFLKDLKAKDVKWKDEEKNINLLLESVLEAASADKHENFGHWGDSCLTDILGFISEKVKRFKMEEQTYGPLVKILIESLNNLENEVLCSVAGDVSGRMQFGIPPLQEEDFHKMFATLSIVLKTEEPVDEENNVLKGFLTSFTSSILACELGSEFAEDIKQLLDAIAELPDLEEYSGDSSIYGHMRMLCVTYVIKNQTTKECVEPFAEHLFKMIREVEWDSLGELAGNVGILAMSNYPDVLLPYLDQIMELMKDKPYPTYPDALSKMYDVYPDEIHSKLTELIGFIPSANATIKTTLVTGLITKIGKENPKVFTEEHVELLKPIIVDPMLMGIGLAILQNIAESNPDVLRKQIQYLQGMALSNVPYVPFIANIYGFIAVEDKEIATASIVILIDLLQKVPSPSQGAILMAIKAIGAKFSELLASYKEVFNKLTEDPHHAESCTYILDIIEGRSLKQVQGELDDQKVEIENVKTDVTATGATVKTLKTEVKKHGRDIEHIKEDVTKAEDRLDNVENTVAETVARVEQLEAMTLVNSPQWSREVSKLLNVEGEHDWRLLSLRLGYSNDDVRAWATQPDPCLAMLNEWFATHKTSDATKGAVSALEDMGREDAASIIGKALESVINIVGEDETGTTLPPVFLSYQWGHQPQVKLLKQHLEKAGFQCWMDTGQMGGGDKLFGKIDAGIRASKVVICCVSKKYASSANCNREVHLAVNLWKPIIPLLMEQMSWPPEGAMGPIFGEYLFVRFFQRQHEQTHDQRYWPVPKMEELLMQIRIQVPPDTMLVTDEYKDLWMPKEEVIVIPQPSSNTTTVTKSVSTPSETSEPVGPQIFISYQWGKQPEIKALYSRLTELGYTCWLDINQMGGGDSLYDKIDKGVRSCKVVLNCITKKYAISANCRREVSLADALRKPMIPLLLEKMDWPPEGPMSMPFTQLLFINFYRDEEVQTKWTGPKVDELLQKLKEYLPDVETHRPKSVDIKQAPTTPKKFNAKKEWKKVRNVTKATSAIKSNYCVIV